MFCYSGVIYSGVKLCNTWTNITSILGCKSASADAILSRDYALLIHLQEAVWKVNFRGSDWQQKVWLRPAEIRGKRRSLNPAIFAILSLLLSRRLIDVWREYVSLLSTIAWELCSVFFTSCHVLCGEGNVSFPSFYFSHWLHCFESLLRWLNTRRMLRVYVSKIVFVKKINLRLGA